MRTFRVSCTSRDPLPCNPPNPETPHRAFNVQVSDQCLRELSKIATNLTDLVISFYPGNGVCFPAWSQPSDTAGGKFWDTHGPYFGHSLDILSNFYNLTRIELLNLWGPLEPCIASITKLLEQSRLLQNLSLSLGEACYGEHLMNLGEDEAGSLLRKICCSFPDDDCLLNLKLLHVGYGINVPEVTELSRLTNLQMLTDFAVHNE